MGHPDPDVTAQNLFDASVLELSVPAMRRIVSYEELLGGLTSLFRALEGCEDVAVIGITRLDSPDNEGCNWSRSLVLDPRDVAAPVYALAYPLVLESARKQWNLR